VHVDASAIELGALLIQPGEGGIYHPIEFSRRKLSYSEHNYNTTEREGLSMVYTYLLWQHFKMFTDNFSLRYLVNNLVLGGRI
jgi:hypothetical protein